MITSLFYPGLILLALGFIIGVMKQTWLLSGFNEKRVSNKAKLSKLVGSYNFAMGAIFIVASFVDLISPEPMFIILVVGYVLLIGYVNTRMVE